MAKSRFLFCAILMVFGGMSSAQAVDDSVIQQQLDALRQRVSELEKRINALDTPQVQKALHEANGPKNPGRGDVADNWRFLEIGYDYDKVRRLLGAPERVKSGPMEFWFYSARGLDGPHVTFVFKRVNSWTGPQAE